MSTYHVQKQTIPGGFKLSITRGNRCLTHRGFLNALQQTNELADCMSGQIVATGYSAVFWEMPPVTTGLLDESFQCVLLESSQLALLRCDASPFSEHFADSAPIVVFPNLGGDALLVVPSARQGGDYPHLAAFCHRAPILLQRLLWKSLAATVVGQLGAAPLWVSTAGLGVGWLHVRLDTRPKYYSYAPYRIWPPSTEK